MNKKILLVVLIVAFIGYGAYTFTDTVTPYVSVMKAKETGSNCQVKGVLDPAAPAPREEGKEFIFGLKDEDDGSVMNVHLKGSKPDQFDEAVHIVAIGKFDKDADVFRADKLLIKCPSKYESEKGKPYDKGKN